MFKFGWLTVTAEDLAVWKQYPNAAFTLLRTAPRKAKMNFALAHSSCGKISRLVRSEAPAETAFEAVFCLQFPN